MNWDFKNNQLGAFVNFIGSKISSKNTHKLNKQTHTHSYIYIHNHTHIHIHTQTHTHTHIHSNTHKHKYIQTHKYTHYTYAIKMAKINYSFTELGCRQ